MEKRAAQFNSEDLKRNLMEADRVAKGEINQFDLQSRVYKKNGGLVWLQHSGTLSCHPVTNEKHLVGLLRDITQEKANIERLKYLADFDGLTQAYNRRSGLLKLEFDVEAVESVTIIYIDIDKFKYINDTYGHAVGDRALKGFCAKLNEMMPESTYLIRLGGDEILCVLLNQSETVVSETLEHLMSRCIYLKRTVALNRKVLIWKHGENFKRKNELQFVIVKGIIKLSTISSRKLSTYRGDAKQLGYLCCNEWTLLERFCGKGAIPCKRIYITVKPRYGSTEIYTDEDIIQSKILEEKANENYSWKTSDYL